MHALMLKNEAQKNSGKMYSRNNCTVTSYFIIGWTGTLRVDLI